MSPDLLADPRTGVVRALDPAAIPAHFPSSFALTTSRIADTSRFGGWASDPAGAGYAFADPAAVRAAAIGEAVERYCGNLVPPGLVRATHESLGPRALDPTTFAFFSPEQYAAPGFPAVPMTTDLEMEWVAGRDLVDDAEVLVPAGPVWPSYHSPVGARRGPLTNPVIQAGLAAGPDRDFAVWGGLREVVERDAMTLSWYGGLGVRSLDPPAWLASFAAGPDGLLATRFVALASPFGLPVVAALVTDPTTGLLSLGTGVDPDPVTAATKAFAEALQLQLVLGDYDDPDGAFAAAAAHPHSPLKPWRADRAYGSAYLPDRSDVVDYACHLQLHLDPAVRAEFETELAGRTTDRVALESLAGPVRGTGDVVDVLTLAGHRVVAVDVTTPDVAPMGVTVVRVLVPGLYSNAPLGLPFLGGTRLAAARRSSPFPVPHTPLPH